MAEVRGRMNPTKDRLMTLISEAHTALQPKNTHVTGNLNFSIWDLPNIPLVSVKVAPVQIRDEVYDRIFEGGVGVTTRGSTALFNVTVHIHTSACSTAGEELAKHAQDLTDSIVDYLTLQAPNQSVYGIEDIYDFQPRESTPAGVRFSRVVMTLKLLTQRFD